MPDISMCTNFTCLRRNDCFRYRAWPSKSHQAYGAFEREDCRYRLPIEGRNVRETSDVDLEHTNGTF